MQKGIAFALLGLLLSMVVRATVMGAPVQPSDLRIGVAFELYTTAKMPPSDVAAAQHAVSGLATHLTAPGYRNYFTGCYRTANSGCPNARIAVAVVFMNKADPSAKTYPVRMIARGVTDERAATALTLSSVDLSGAVTEVKNPLLPSDADLESLLGKPVLADGIIGIAAYSPYLQLVPETATDRKYIGVLAGYLDDQRLFSTPSQYTGIDNSNALASGSGTSASICANSPRYLHYNVNITSRPRPLEGTTVLHVQSTGQVIDCVNPGSRLTFADDWNYPVATTKSPLSSLVTLLGILFVSKTNSWTNVASAGSSFSSFIDVDPSSSAVEQEVYDRALASLVRRMCAMAAANAAEQAAPNAQSVAAVVTPTPSPAPGQVSILSTPETTTSGTTPAATAATAATTPLGVGEQSLTAPPPLICDPPDGRRQSSIDANRL